MGESAVKTFIRKTYQTKSTIPIIISIMIGMFLLFLILELFDRSSSTNITEFIYRKLNLSPNFKEFIYKPWTLVTHAFAYRGFIPLIFDCLWLFWIGNMFLNLLSNKQFLFVFFGGILTSAFVFLLLNSVLSELEISIPWTSITFGIAATLSSLIVVSPKAEIRLMLFGIVRMQIVALVYFIILIISYVSIKEYTLVLALLSAILFGFLFSKSLQNGNDWSKIFKIKKHRHLKVVHGHNTGQNIETPNQETIDKILDKISISGYESLSKGEKETLFKASKK